MTLTRRWPLRTLLTFADGQQWRVLRYKQHGNYVMLGRVTSTSPSVLDLQVWRAVAFVEYQIKPPSPPEDQP